MNKTSSDCLFPEILGLETRQQNRAEQAMSSILRAFSAGLFCLFLGALAASAQEFGTINFDFDSDQLDAESRQEVAEIAERLSATSSYKPTVVVGYTDAVGTSAYNLDLGQRRAKAVADALVAAGVPVDRIGAVSSRGKADLLVTVATAERRNRRVTVRLGDILAACQNYRNVALSQNAVGQELQNDLSLRLTEAVEHYSKLTASGANGPAFQMAGAAREDCGQAVGYDVSSVRKLEYSKRCFCSSARMRTALGS
jgi:outer membrane protein OmpA-like peptidoglycan-associated protein